MQKAGLRSFWVISLRCYALNHNEMEITWVELDSYKEAQMQEWSALKNYGKKFGELPPLNLQALRDKYATVGSEVGRSRVSKKLDQKLKDIIGC